MERQLLTSKTFLARDLELKLVIIVIENFIQSSILTLLEPKKKVPLCEALL